MDATFSAPRGMGGTHQPPPDKSITHRALMLAAVSASSSYIHRPLATGDCISTRRCLQRLGVSFQEDGDGLRVTGTGLRGFSEPAGPLDAENSGTTTRLLSGLLAGQDLFAVLTGDGSLLRRPMARVVEPLRRMGARIEGRDRGRLAPLCFLPGSGRLQPVSWNLEVPSAQVKSAVLLAALRAEAPCAITGEVASRDHTERMLRALGVSLESGDSGLRLSPPDSLPGFEAEVPGDVSSASFLIAAALVTGGEVTIRDCGLNPTRLGFVEAVKRMGASVQVTVERSSLGEPIGTIHVAAGALSGTDVTPGEVPELIDEIPLVAVLGLYARGVTRVRGAGELRVKESDRLAMIRQMAESLGGRIEVFEDGFAVEGPQRLRPGTVDPQADHRIAMAAAVAGAGIAGGARVRDFDCSRVSYPDFIRDFTSLGGQVA